MAKSVKPVNLQKDPSDGLRLQEFLQGGKKCSGTDTLPMNFASRRKISAKRRESRRWRDPLEKALRPENIILRETNTSEAKTADALLLLGRAIEQCGIENEIATFLKKKFDEKHGELLIKAK